jgi:hypothetical protein
MSLSKQHAIATRMEVNVQLHAFLMLALDGDGWSTLRPCYLPRKIPRVYYAERTQNKSGRGIEEESRSLTGNLILVAQAITLTTEVWRNIRDFYISLCLIQDMFGAGNKRWPGKDVVCASSWTRAGEVSFECGSRHVE